MISPIADLHTHTIATDHAYSTLLENVAYASKRGLKAIAMTEHCPAIGDAPHEFHYGYTQIPREIEGIIVLKGAELNVLNTAGEVDLPENTLRRLDWVIASMHRPCFAPDQPMEAVNEAWTNIAKNPYIDCIGHCGDQGYRFDYEKIIPLFKQYGKVVEINNHSFKARPGTDENCKEIARLCKQYEVPIVVNTDAHFALSVGVFDRALAALKEVDFPEELVLNNDLKRLVDFINAKPHKNKIEWSE